MFPGTLSNHAHDTLALLGKQNLLKTAYLAGGSSLALQLGHRSSIDFDFFSENDFSSKNVNKQLKKIGSYTVENETPKTMVGKFNEVKFSLFYYPYHLIGLKKPYEGVFLASPEDIAAMKLVAITDRGTKKDYIDLYFLANKRCNFDEMFKFYEKKYHLLKSNLVTLIKSLSYFVDADGSEMPEMITKISWNEVREFFKKETTRLGNKYL